MQDSLVDAMSGATRDSRIVGFWILCNSQGVWVQLCLIVVHLHASSPHLRCTLLYESTNKIGATTGIVNWFTTAFNEGIVKANPHSPIRSTLACKVSVRIINFPPYS